MNIKILTLNLLVILMFPKPCQARVKMDSKFTVASAFLAVWLIIEKYNKYYINKSFTKCKADLEKYKADDFSEELIKKARKHLNDLNKELIVEIPLDNNCFNKIASFKIKLDINHQIKKLSSYYKNNNIILSDLESKLMTWKQKNKIKYFEVGEKLLIKLKPWDGILKNSIDISEISKNILNLEKLYKNLNSIYDLELYIIKNKYEKNNYVYSLDKIILEKFNVFKYKFPRISYIEDLTNNINNLTNLSILSKDDYQKHLGIFNDCKIELINNRVSLLITNLKNINREISLSKNYISEKNRKVKFQIEVKELNHKIEIESLNQKAILQRELNYSKRLDNERYNQKLQYEQMRLELSKIKQNIALKEKEKEYISKNKKLEQSHKDQINKLNDDINSYKKDIEDLNSQILKLRIDIGNLKNQLNDSYFPEASAPPEYLIQQSV